MMKLIQKGRILFNGWFAPLPNPQKWIFIVGCYNSGTTLLHDLLATHPQIGSMPDEGQFFTNQLLLPKSVGLPRLWAIKPEMFYLNESDAPAINLERLKRQWGGRFNNVHKPVLIEKSPTNVARLRWLQKHFDNAYFIGIIRNGYVVAEGIRRKAGHSLELAARQWRESNKIMLRDFDYLTQKKLITYEGLTEQPAVMIKEILQFLGLDTNITTNLKNQVWNVHEQASVIQNMNHKSLANLTPQEYHQIEQVAGDLLKQLAYMN